MQGGAEKGRSSTAQYSVYVRGGEGGGALMLLFLKLVFNSLFSNKQPYRSMFSLFSVATATRGNVVCLASCQGTMINPVGKRNAYNQAET